MGQQVGGAWIDAEPGARAGTEGLVALGVLDNVPEMLEVGVTSALLLGDAVWLTGDLGCVGPAVFLDALVMGPAEFDIGPALGLLPPIASQEQTDGVMDSCLMCQVVCQLGKSTMK